MSQSVGPRKWELEKSAIDAAYQEQIGELFKAFYFGTRVGGKEEKEALAKFKTNTEALHRAHVHAISVYSDHDSF